jgi:hypothetical protein
MFTGHKSALPVNGAAVAEASRCEEDVSALAHLVVPEHSIIRDVAEQHELASRVVARSLQPPTAREQSSNRTVAASPSEPRIEYLKLGRDEIGHRHSCCGLFASLGCCDSIDKGALNFCRDTHRTTTRCALNQSKRSLAIISLLKEHPGR